MKKLFPLLTLGAVLFGTAHLNSTAQAGPHLHFSFSPGCLPVPVHRHHGDPYRYNAAASLYRLHSLQSHASHYHGYHPRYTSTHISSPTCATPVYKVRTEVVNRVCQKMTFYDSCGRPVCRNVHITVYRDVYSNGSCRIWQQASY